MEETLISVDSNMKGLIALEDQEQWGTFQILELIDLPLQGADYTWYRGEEDSTQASRIDRFLISTEWSDNFG